MSEHYRTVWEDPEFVRLANEHRRIFGPPDPGAAHGKPPAWEAVQRWLNDRHGTRALSVALPLETGALQTEPVVSVDGQTEIILDRQKVYGHAPYVGDKFVYRWDCVQYPDGRWVAGEAWRQVLPQTPEDW